jgi:hypothetical protein
MNLSIRTLHGYTIDKARPDIKQGALKKPRKGEIKQIHDAVIKV